MRVKLKLTHTYLKHQLTLKSNTQVLWILLHYKDDTFISIITFKKTETTEKMQSTALDDGFYTTDHEKASDKAANYRNEEHNIQNGPQTAHFLWLNKWSVLHGFHSQQMKALKQSKYALFVDSALMGLDIPSLQDCG